MSAEMFLSVHQDAKIRYLEIQSTARVSDLTASAIKWELEYRLLYAMVVAGKSATFATNAMKAFLMHSTPEEGPFTYIRKLIRRGELRSRLELARVGNYTKLEKGFSGAAESGFDLSAVNADQLQTLHGVGPKTAKFFIIWTREGEDHAAIDTHVLKWLGYKKHTGLRNTPNGPLYQHLERVFIEESKARGMTARELDSKIWDHCSSGAVTWSNFQDAAAWTDELK